MKMKHFEEFLVTTVLLAVVSTLMSIILHPILFIGVWNKYGMILPLAFVGRLIVHISTRIDLVGIVLARLAPNFKSALDIPAEWFTVMWIGISLMLLVALWLRRTFQEEMRRPLTPFWKITK